MKNICQKIHKTLLDANNIVIAIHQNPDGDALGSATAMAEYLKMHKKNVDIFSVGFQQEAWNFLTHIELVSENSAVFEKEFDLLLVLDSGDPKYANIEKQIERTDIITINIDHHITNTSYGHHNLVKPDASSTCEIIFEYLKHNNIVINHHMANSLLSGIITDTGNFSNSATNLKTINISGQLLKRGGNLNLINKKVNKNQTIGALKLWGKAFARLDKHEGLDMAYTYLTKKDFLEEGVTDKDSEGISNFLNNIKETKICLLLKEVEDNQMKGSLRTTNDDVDLSALAQKLGGGGHKKASGFTLDGNVEDIIKKIEEVYKA